MDNEEVQEVTEEVKDVPLEPLEVKVVNQKEDKKSDYDSKDDSEYEDQLITKEEIKEFEDEK